MLVYQYNISYKSFEPLKNFLHKNWKSRRLVINNQLTWSKCFAKYVRWTKSYRRLCTLCTFSCRDCLCLLDTGGPLLHLGLFCYNILFCGGHQHGLLCLLHVLFQVLCHGHCVRELCHRRFCDQSYCFWKLNLDFFDAGNTSSLMRKIIYIKYLLTVNTKSTCT